MQNNLTPQQQRQLHEAGAAYREVVDRLYALQEWAGMSQDWVQETATQISKEVQDTTGIDLGEL
jgi:hypothetical protein